MKSLLQVVVDITLSQVGAASDRIEVPADASKVSAHLIVDDDHATGIGNAVVELQRSISQEDIREEAGHFTGYTSAKQLTAAAPMMTDVSVSGVNWIRTRTATADGAADASAQVVLAFY